MNTRNRRQWKFNLALAVGALVALVLCVQCVRTYLYIDSVLLPQQAEREAERQGGVLATAARAANVTVPSALAPELERVLETASDRVLWLRVLNPDSGVLAQAGSPSVASKVPAHWWERVEKHDSLGAVVETPYGKAFIAMLPLRMPHPAAPPAANWHPVAYVLEVAISLKSVAGAFQGLRDNLIVGLLASLALLLSLALIALRAPHYLRGRYLENELQLARRVQSDLRPNPESVSPHVEFAACSIAADHVGGDFYDVFEVGSGEVAIVLGDVSGKGVSAALLVSVLQGAIRSSTGARHELACRRINRMLCERTACERFATMFWGVFDPASGVLRYVNAGHAAPMLVRHSTGRIERLNEGGPVIGLLPDARYSAGAVVLEASDTLILYSDGINETADRNGEEFGDGRVEQIVSAAHGAAPEELCDRIMQRVNSFANDETPPDDRTLMVVRFPFAPVPAPQDEAATEQLLSL